MGLAGKYPYWLTNRKLLGDAPAKWVKLQTSNNEVTLA